jgi:hypothetical protein
LAQLVPKDFAILFVGPTEIAGDKIELSVLHLGRLD